MTPLICIRFRGSWQRMYFRLQRECHCGTSKEPHRQGLGESNRLDIPFLYYNRPAIPCPTY